MKNTFTLLAGILALSMNAFTPATASNDLTELPIEDLLNLKIFSASKFMQSVDEAPAAVTIITAGDIKSQGYRTLADVLRSIRGLYVTYDHNYSYVGARGFGRPGDYNTRILFLLDGYRLNDNIYDQGLIGTEFILDIELIDRIEFVPGPGSAVYGNNAFFGVVNVITKKAQYIEGVEAATHFASHNARSGRLTYGHVLENGMGLTLSVSGARNQGEDVFFPEFNGSAINGNYDKYQRIFAKLENKRFTLTAAHSERKKGTPTAAFGQLFHDTRSNIIDAQSLFSLVYQNQSGEHLDVFTRLSHGQYDFQGNYIYTGSQSRDDGIGRWWNMEARVISIAIENHKLLTGIEYQWNPRQDQYALDPGSGVYSLNAPSTSHSSGIYIQDEITWNDSLIFNIGVRHDRYNIQETHTTPRLSAIYKAGAHTTLKALYGSAFRAPNVHERLYFPANPTLSTEKITTLEGIIEHHISHATRVTASVYHYNLSQLIDLNSNKVLFFENIDSVTAKGLEIEGEHHFDNDAKIKSSYTYQRPEKIATGKSLDNSPKHLAKINYVTPVLNNTFKAGTELQYTSGRTTYLGDNISGFWLANLTLTKYGLHKGLEVSASIYNLFDKQYADPPSAEHLDELGRSLTRLPQDGRNFRVGLGYTF